MKFSPLAYNNCGYGEKYQTIQFRLSIVWMCVKDKVALVLYERVVWVIRG
jgi:hypothetical protein